MGGNGPSFGTFSSHLRNFTPRPVPSRAQMHWSGLLSVYGVFPMFELWNHSNRVRYRTEKSLFFSLFAAKFCWGAANQPLGILNDKQGVIGLVC
jgi:hypothetical protein